MRSAPFIQYNMFDDVDFCTAGFSTRYGGVSSGCFSSMNLGFGRNDNPDSVRKNFEIMGTSAGFVPENVCLPNQCHTRSVRVVTETERGSGYLTPKVEEPVDAQITNIPGITLICYGADCVPVYLCDEKRKAIGLCHAGWKGTILNIVEAATEQMKTNYGTVSADIKAVIGPSICRDCYEVSADVADQFISVYTALENEYEIKDVLTPVEGNYPLQYSIKNSDNFEMSCTSSKNSLKGTIVTDIGNGKYLLNLWKANYINLLKAGLKPENISVSCICTKCNHNMFFSHRFHKDARGVNAAFMFIK